LPLTVLYVDFGRRLHQSPPPKPTRNRISEIEQQAESSGRKNDGFYRRHVCVTIIHGISKHCSCLILPPIPPPILNRQHLSCDDRL